MAKLNNVKTTESDIVLITSQSRPVYQRRNKQWVPSSSSSDVNNKSLFLIRATQIQSATPVIHDLY